MIRSFKYLLLSALLATSAHVTHAQQGKKADSVTPLNVIETFNVGDNVYVRALAVEQKTGALWVGTSKGVHEIDVNSGKPLSRLKD